MPENSFIPASFFSIITPQLKAALLGCSRQHGIISTRKAFAAMRYNNYLVTLLQSIESEKIPADQNSTPFYGEMSTSNIKASPCVINTANALLRNREREAKVDEEEFFVKLVEVSCGPTVEGWRSDGYNRDRVAVMLKNIKADDRREGSSEYEEYEEYSEYRSEPSAPRQSQTSNNNNNREGSEQISAATQQAPSQPSSSSAQQEENADDSKCKICFENDVNTVFVPCGHIAVCADCGTNMNACPICRAPVEKVMRTFKA